MSEWYYVSGEAARGPVGLKALLAELSNSSEPLQVLVWRTGFADWTHAGSVPEIAELIAKPPPLPSTPRPKRSEGFWRSTVAIAASLAVVWVTSSYNSLGSFPLEIGRLLGPLPLFIGLDWATRRRRQFAEQLAKNTTEASLLRIATDQSPGRGGS
jgi:hypothetical protein